MAIGQYPANALQGVQLIRRALAVGFTLDELATVLSVKDRGGAPCSEVRALAAAKLADVETRLREMIELRNALRAVLKDWDTRLERRAPGQRAHPLDAQCRYQWQRQSPTSLASQLSQRKKE